MDHRSKYKKKFIQFLKEYIGEHFCDLGLYKEITKITKERKDKLDLIKIKSSCSAKDTIKKMKRQDTD